MTRSSMSSCNKMEELGFDENMSKFMQRSMNLSSDQFVMFSAVEIKTSWIQKC